MNTMSYFSSKPREKFARFFVAMALWLGAFSPVAPLARAQEFEPPPPLSNASELERQAVEATLDDLKRAALARDANALAFFGAGLPADAAPLRLSTRLTHLATTPNGALARQQYTLVIEREPSVVLASGAQELWLSRAPEGGFSLQKRFAVAPDALAEMQSAAAQKWTETAPDGTDKSGDSVLDLVASRVGGRWISLRSQVWSGSLRAEEELGTPNPRDWIAARMGAAPKGRAVTAHFVLDRGKTGWSGVGAAFNEARLLPRPADQAATLLRERVAGRGYVLPEAHRDFGIALSRLGLWNEAAEELQKAELMQPGLVSPQVLKEAEASRVRDPENMVRQQKRNEERIGFGDEHPDYLIQALSREQANQPSVLGALRIALEYSRLAEVGRATAWGKQAEILMRGGVRPQDQDWVRLLSEHLRERQGLERIKPSNILHSNLFTARVWPGDGRAVAFLAALEEAQHTVYAGFSIPMGNTEVILWRDQGEFQRYTTRFTEQGAGEFVAALTLTKLVSTAGGPIVLGEEFNTFTDPRDLNAQSNDGMFGTVAHEYGHVAVRQLSRGHMVPVWFNEGIASSVEGGYEGYRGRVARAVNAGAQLSMRELLAWQFDGERAFLAYSQANSIVDFIVVQWGKDAVLDVLRRIGRGVEPDDAFRAVLRVSQNQLWEQWMQNGIT